MVGMGVGLGAGRVYTDIHQLCYSQKEA